MPIEPTPWVVIGTVQGVRTWYSVPILRSKGVIHTIYSVSDPQKLCPVAGKRATFPSRRHQWIDVSPVTAQNQGVMSVYPCKDQVVVVVVF